MYRMSIKATNQEIVAGDWGMVRTKRLFAGTEIRTLATLRPLELKSSALTPPPHPLLKEAKGVCQDSIQPFSGIDVARAHCDLNVEHPVVVLVVFAFENVVSVSEYLL